MYKVFSFLFHQHRLVYSHHLASFEDRNEIERKYSRPSNNHRAYTNAPIMIQTAITASSFSLFFFPLRLEGVVQPANSTNPIGFVFFATLQPLSMLVDHALHRPTKRVGVSQTVRSIFTESIEILLLEWNLHSCVPNICY